PQRVSRLPLSSGKWGLLRSLARGDQCGAGGRAFRGLTRSATEWSAARRKPVRAAVLPFSATISADVKARRLPTSERRKRNGDIPHFLAKGDRPAAGLSPFAREAGKLGMSPFLSRNARGLDAAKTVRRGPER